MGTFALSACSLQSLAHDKCPEYSERFLSRPIVMFKFIGAAVAVAVVAIDPDPDYDSDAELAADRFPGVAKVQDDDYYSSHTTNSGQKWALDTRLHLLAPVFPPVFQCPVSTVSSPILSSPVTLGNGHYHQPVLWGLEG